jgi:DNA polymerase-1
LGKRVLLIDADVIAYNAATACLKELEYEPGYWTWHASFEEVLETFDSQISTIQRTLKGEPVLCLTDSEGNFRRGVLPTYKGKRGKKPLVLKALKEFLIEKRGAYFRPGLEGDDCMGILATRSNPKGEDRIIVSIDKDMMQIPAGYVRWPDTAITRTTSEQADLFHLRQTLTGDVTDGYGGCPGIGPVKADKLLAKDPSWATVLAAFEDAGLTEADALVQARVARILRASDYDFQKKEPILWSPT